MKHFLSIFSILTLFFALTSCDNDSPNNVPADLEVQNFVWKGLNAYYFWQQDIPNLADDRFSSQEQLNTFLSPYESAPNDLFYSLLNDYPNVDKYSWIVDDYIALEELLYQGITGSNGVNFRLGFESGSSTDLFGYVRYIVDNSDASTKNIGRGDTFNAVNGTPLTISNYRELLFSTDSYTLNMADYNSGNPISNGVSVDLTKFQLQENPVFKTEVIEDSGKKIGYLMYNRFNREFHSELNSAFATFQAEGITDLVLDLRYNPGGTTSTALFLAGMITGQFTGELFSQEVWNNKWQGYYTNNNPDWLINNFVNQTDTGESLNSLNLENIVILTTGSTASASELIINGLNPYINVTTIGTTTEGKSVGSVTLYDSPNYRREGANPNHTWATQPIVLEIQNKLGINNPTGFIPNISNPENLSNLGVLGDVSEPLFARAIQFITTGSKMSSGKDKIVEHEFVTDSNRESLTGSNMYVDKELPSFQ